MNSFYQPVLSSAILTVTVCHAASTVSGSETHTSATMRSAGSSLIGGQNRADFFKSLRESAKSAVRAHFADFF